jgi:hypothetical protein
MRNQLGHSKYLTVERTEEGNDIFRSYETPILVLDEKNSVLFADYRKYSASTSRHQLQLQHFRPEYKLPEQRERVTYEYCLKQATEVGDGEKYQACYRAKDNPYDPWHECFAGSVWLWDTAYERLYEWSAEKYGVYNEQNVNDNFVGTF